MFALIHQPSRNAMQSGMGNTRKWVIEFPRHMERYTDPLTGTTGSRDTLQQLDLEFESKDAAISYAKSNSIPFQVVEKAKPARISRGYSDNFSYDRKFPWTH